MTIKAVLILERAINYLLPSEVAHMTDISAKADRLLFCKTELASSPLLLHPLLRKEVKRLENENATEVRLRWTDCFKNTRVSAAFHIFLIVLVLIVLASIGAAIGPRIPPYW